MDFQVGKRGDVHSVVLWYKQWGKSVFLRSRSQAAAAVIARMAEGKCDCDSQRRAVFAAR